MGQIPTAQWALSGWLPNRDTGDSAALPVPLWRARAGDRHTTPCSPDWLITALNDQHAYLQFDPNADARTHPRVGDIVGSGISHPCTTFDKWRWMPVVDDDYRVIDAISIHF